MCYRREICRDIKSKSVRLRGDRAKGREGERVRTGMGWKREGGWLESGGRGLNGGGAAREGRNAATMFGL